MSVLVAKRYYERGQRELAAGHTEAAIDTFRSAVDLYPGYVAGRIAYAVALYRFGDSPRAAQVLRAGLARPAPKRDVAQLWANLGDLLTACGDFPGAEDAFGQAVSTMPELERRAAAGRARVFAKQGRYADAFAQLGVAAGADSADATDATPAAGD